MMARPSPRDWQEELAGFLRSTSAKVLFVAYPDKKDARPVDMNVFGPTISIGDLQGWRQDLYRDDIHPTPEGNVILATEITSAVLRLAEPPIASR